MVPNAQNVFREAWNMVTKVKDSEKYMSCAEAWIYFILKHFKVVFLFTNHFFVQIKFIQIEI